MPEVESQAKTPAQLGYRMPAEWEPHVSTWLAWPRSDGISFPDRFEMIPALYAALVRELVQVEQVNINVWNAAMEEWARTLLRNWHTPMDRVRFHHFPAYEPWIRDHGPIFLVRNQQGLRSRAVVDWAYNAWGRRYAPYHLDDAIPRHVAACRDCLLFTSDMILEGGAIDVNGYGSLLATEACLLNPNRNPHLGRAETERHLGDFLGARNILWLAGGLAGSDADGQTDEVCRFIGPGKIVAVVEEDPADANYPVLQENLRRLRTFRDHLGQAFRIVSMPTPGCIEHQGRRVPASYANFYIANRLVIVPVFNHPNDEIALNILQTEFPGRRVVGIDSTELIWGLGSFHGITQQEPG